MSKPELCVLYLFIYKLYLHCCKFKSQYSTLCFLYANGSIVLIHIIEKCTVQKMFFKSFALVNTGNKKSDLSKNMLNMPKE